MSEKPEQDDLLLRLDRAAKRIRSRGAPPPGGAATPPCAAARPELLDAGHESPAYHAIGYLSNAKRALTAAIGALYVDPAYRQVLREIEDAHDRIQCIQDQL